MRLHTLRLFAIIFAAAAFAAVVFSVATPARAQVAPTIAPSALPSVPVGGCSGVSATGVCASPSPAPSPTVNPQALQTLKTECVTFGGAGQPLYWVSQVGNAVYSAVTLQSISLNIAKTVGNEAIGLTFFMWLLSLIPLAKEVRQLARSASPRALLDVPVTKISALLFTIIIIGVLSGTVGGFTVNSTGGQGATQPGTLAQALPNAGAYLIQTLVGPTESQIQKQMEPTGVTLTMEPVPTTGGGMAVESLCTWVKWVQGAQIFGQIAAGQLNANSWVIGEGMVVIALTGLIMILTIIPQVAAFLAILILFIKQLILGLDSGIVSSIGLFSLAFLVNDKTKEYGQAFYKKLVNLFANGAAIALATFFAINIQSLGMGEVVTLFGASSNPWAEMGVFVACVWFFGALSLGIAFSTEKIVASWLTGSLGVEAAGVIGGIASTAGLAAGGIGLVKGALSRAGGKKNAVAPADDQGVGGAGGTSGAQTAGGGDGSSGSPTSQTPEERAGLAPENVGDVPPEKTPVPNAADNTADVSPDDVAPERETSGANAEAPSADSEGSGATSPEGESGAPADDEVDAPGAEAEPEPVGASPAADHSLDLASGAVGAAAALGALGERVAAAKGAFDRSGAGLAARRIGRTVGRAGSLSARIAHAGTAGLLNSSMMRHAATTLHEGARGGATTMGHHFGQGALASAPKMQGPAAPPPTGMSNAKSELAMQSGAQAEAATMFAGATPAAQAAFERVSSMTAAGAKAIDAGRKDVAASTLLAAAVHADTHAAALEDMNAPAPQIAYMQESAGRLREAARNLSAIPSQGPAVRQMIDPDTNHAAITVNNPVVPREQREQLAQSLSAVHNLAPGGSVAGSRAAIAADMAIGALSSRTMRAADVQRFVRQASEAARIGAAADREIGSPNAQVWDSMRTAFQPILGEPGDMAPPSPAQEAPTLS